MHFCIYCLACCIILWSACCFQDICSLYIYIHIYMCDVFSWFYNFPVLCPYLWLLLRLLFRGYKFSCLKGPWRQHTFLFYLEELAPFWPLRMFFFHQKKKRSLILTNFQNSRYTTPVVTSLGKYKEQSNELVNYLFELKQHDKMEPEAPLPSHSHVYWQWVLLAAANHTN